MLHRQCILDNEHPWVQSILTNLRLIGSQSSPKHPYYFDYQDLTLMWVTRRDVLFLQMAGTMVSIRLIPFQFLTAEVELL